MGGVSYGTCPKELGFLMRTFEHFIFDDSNSPSSRFLGLGQGRTGKLEKKFPMLSVVDGDKKIELCIQRRQETVCVCVYIRPFYRVEQRDREMKTNSG